MTTHLNSHESRETVMISLSTDGSIDIWTPTLDDSDLYAPLDSGSVSYDLSWFRRARICTLHRGLFGLDGSSVLIIHILNGNLVVAMHVAPTSIITGYTFTRRIRGFPSCMFAEV